MWEFFECFDRRGQREFSLWRLELPRIERALLDEKMRMIQVFGQASCLKGPIRGHRHLYKIRVQGPTVALRPLLCRGPIRMDREFTMLQQMTEVGGKDTPPGAKSEADRCRSEIIRDPSRRVRYEVPQP